MTKGIHTKCQTDIIYIIETDIDHITQNEFVKWIFKWKTQTTLFYRIKVYSQFTSN